MNADQRIAGRFTGASPRAGRVARLAILSLLVAAGGCSSMDDIDRRIDRVVADQTQRMGGDSVAPSLRQKVLDSYDVPDQARKDPPSNNPSAEELTYKGADSARDVLGRLDSYAEIPDGATTLDLPEVLERTQRTAREYLNAEEEYMLAAIRLLIERHRWSPRFFDDLATSISADSDRGTYSTALNVINTLRATQRLPYGGEVEARLVTSAVQQLTEAVGDEYTQASQLVIGANVPLLRGAGLVAQEDIIQAERNVVYAARSFEQFRRAFLVDIATDYFNLLAQQANIRNQEERLRSVIQFYEQTKALVEAGRERPFQARNVEQNVLTSRDSLISARESYILSLDRFKVRLGIPVQEAIALAPMTLDLADPEIGVNEAAALALDYRLDYQNEADRVDDSRRAVANARNNLLPDLNAAASAALNTDSDNRVAGISFDGPQTDYNASLTLGLPLDREIERLNLRSSIIDLQQQIRSFELFRDNLILDARQSVREIDRARFSLRLQEQAVQINELRLEELRIKVAEVDPQTRLDAENELLRSRNDRDSAMRDLRIAILQYLLRTGQMRVRPDGRLMPLRDMEIQMEPVGASGPGSAPGDPAAAQNPARPGEPAEQPAPEDFEPTDPAPPPENP